MTVEDLRFDGRVVIVTGAGAGLGRSYALLFGERGASVVVNDLGSSRHGDGNDAKVADQVVKEIRKKGGSAIADYNSVVEGEKIVKTALDNFGRIDIIVNNAGILRDKTFARLSENDWDLVHNVHLKGAYKTTQAAWEHFRKQKYGRVIVTSSNSGLYGNFGQGNYCAAKMGLVGLCKNMAIEGRNYNINCNVIVPTAASRLTEDILPSEFFAELKPELIAPVVLWLCHEQCQESGSIIESAAGWAGKCDLIRGRGCILRDRISDLVSPEEVMKRWSNVVDMQGAEVMGSIEEVTGSLIGQLDAMKSNEENIANANEGEDEGSKYFISHKECIIYALGIGMSIEDPGNLKYLYECDPEFCAFPTQVIIPGQMAVMSSPIITKAIPSREVELSQVLHGEQYLEVFKPLPTAGTVTSKMYIVDVLDKGRHALIVAGVDTYDEKGDVVAHGEMGVVVVNAGGFGGPRSSNKYVNTIEPPPRHPDISVTQPTTINQAALYRISGDSNPLHIDPSFAAVAGYSKPILHGLCTLGFSVRHVLSTFASNNPHFFKAVKVRFAKPVTPGDTLRTDMWRENNRIHFETFIDENGEKVISGAYVDLHEVLASLILNPTSSISLRSETVFDSLKNTVNDRKFEFGNGGVIKFDITNGSKKVATWTVDLTNGVIHRGDPGVELFVDASIIVDDRKLFDMAIGKSNYYKALQNGHFNVLGDIDKVKKLNELMFLKLKL